MYRPFTTNATSPKPSNALVVVLALLVLLAVGGYMLHRNDKLKFDFFMEEDATEEEGAAEDGAAEEGASAEGAAAEGAAAEGAAAEGAAAEGAAADGADEAQGVTLTTDASAGGLDGAGQRAASGRGGACEYAAWGACVDGMQSRTLLNELDRERCSEFQTKECSSIPTEDAVHSEEKKSIEHETPRNTTSANCSYSTWSDCVAGSCTKSRSLLGGDVGSCTELEGECPCEESE